mmetsp:Transcript_57648/g.95308  ORF Transcript_57648/g.95308 Transcript_57648/m.95308 type:complete len:269 (+) Transcript_57648:28-834(+)|eukprot:CAMPEP_0119331492 /NCGR_PEP_ID=MMETSP1333-20130426/80709_1 /TAXON_ID=418940 /ORGANISM="Scyphosphaera apsteinii, Strain RCC1455" /LENGTH=268 /DNA_ID=CAMNT_0007341109 /DNA_START=20 /DNA_END=826 /DNA_ORIENTATION=-
MNRYSVFCGNLPPGIQEDDLIAHFAHIGRVADVRLVRDRKTGQTRNYGFVDFVDEQAMHQVVQQMNQVELNGRALRLEVAANKLDATKAERGSSAFENGPHVRGTWQPEPVSEPDVDSTSRRMSCSGTNDTQHINSLSEAQLWEIVQQTQALAEQDATQARALLISNPSLALGVLRAQIRLGLVTKDSIRNVMSSANELSNTQHAPQQAATQQPRAPPPPPPLGRHPHQVLLEQVKAMTPAQLEALPLAQREQLLRLQQEVRHGAVFC